MRYETIGERLDKIDKRLAKVEREIAEAIKPLAYLDVNETRELSRLHRSIQEKIEERSNEQISVDLAPVRVNSEFITKEPPELFIKQESTHGLLDRPSDEGVIMLNPPAPTVKRPRYCSECARELGENESTFIGRTGDKMFNAPVCLDCAGLPKLQRAFSHPVLITKVAEQPKKRGNEWL